MAEVLDIFTKNGEKIGTISKKEYYSLERQAPWIKCVTCFVIDEKNKKILFEKRGNTEIDSGRLDLCSGHVKSGEAPIFTMTRELSEELGIEIEPSKLKSLGIVKVDYNGLSDITNRKNMRCITHIYGCKISDPKEIQIDKQEVVRHRMVIF